jgi:hypothetical protein
MRLGSHQGAASAAISRRAVAPAAKNAASSAMQPHRRQPLFEILDGAVSRQLLAPQQSGPSSILVEDAKRGCVDTGMQLPLEMAWALRARARHSPDLRGDHHRDPGRKRQPGGAVTCTSRVNVTGSCRLRWGARRRTS